MWHNLWRGQREFWDSNEEAIVRNVAYQKKGDCLFHILSSRHVEYVNSAGSETYVRILAIEFPLNNLDWNHWIQWICICHKIYSVYIANDKKVLTQKYKQKCTFIPEKLSLDFTWILGTTFFQDSFTQSAVEREGECDFVRRFRFHCEVFYLVSMPCCIEFVS